MTQLLCVCVCVCVRFLTTRFHVHLVLASAPSLPACISPDSVRGVLSYTASSRLHWLLCRDLKKQSVVVLLQMCKKKKEEEEKEGERKKQNHTIVDRHKKQMTMEIMINKNNT